MLVPFNVTVTEAANTYRIALICRNFVLSPFPGVCILCIPVSCENTLWLLWSYKHTGSYCAPALNGKFLSPYTESIPTYWRTMCTQYKVTKVDTLARLYKYLWVTCGAVALVRVIILWCMVCIYTIWIRLFNELVTELRT